MVERDRDVADLADDDLSVANDGAWADPVHTEDPDLRVIDQGGHEHAAELAGARDRERAVAELFRLQRAGACRLGEPRDLGGKSFERLGVAGTDDRDDEPVLGLDSDADVEPVEVDDLLAVEPGVQLRELLQRRDDRLQRQRAAGA